MTREALSDQEQLAWLRLARTEGIGPVTFAWLIARYGKASAALEALPDVSRRGGRAVPALPFPQIEGLQEIEDGLAVGARLVCACEPQFPEHLFRIDPVPPLIWVLGRIELLHQPCVAIVGARTGSAAGLKFAGQLASDLGAAGQVVVSGFARGIDTAAHNAALATGTVGVLGGGVRNIYPLENEALFHRMRQEGCLISESPPVHIARGRDFPRRNRLISGLSRAVVVVEAEQKSGSLITARYAAEQNRDVFAVPGSPLDPRAKGTNDLIRQGAHICESAADVLGLLESLPGLHSQGLPFDLEFDEEPVADGELSARILALLSPTPVSRDEIIRLTASPPASVLAALLELNLAGRAILHAGGLVSRS